MKNSELNKVVQTLLSDSVVSEMLEHLDNTEIKRFSDNLRRVLLTGSINLPDQINEEAAADLAKSVADTLLDEINDPLESRWLIQRVWRPYAVKIGII